MRPLEMGHRSVSEGRSRAGRWKADVQSFGFKIGLATGRRGLRSASTVTSFQAQKMNWIS